MKFFNFQKVYLGFILLVLFLICCLPLLNLLKNIVFLESGFSLKYFIQSFESTSTLEAFVNTFKISLATSLFSIVLALPLAWVLARTNLYKSKVWRSLFCLPYMIPPYIGAIAWIFLANPTNGILNSIFGINFFNIYSFLGLVWVMGTFFYTFILLNVLGSMDRMDSSLEEAAKLAGAGPLRVFFQITLPIIFPSVLSGFVLVFLAVSATFGVPAMIGMPAGIYLLTTKIYTYQKMGSMDGLLQGGALSLILLGLALTFLMANQFLMRKGYFKTVGGKTPRQTLVDLNVYQWPVSIILGGVIFTIFLLPVIGIFVCAFSKINGVFNFENFGIQNFIKVFLETEESIRALTNSLVLGIGAATTSSFMGLFLAYIIVKTRVKFRHWIEVFSSLPYAAPGSVIAIALILTFSGRFLGILPSLYNTLFLICLAYIVKDLNFSVKTLSDGFGQIDDSLAEAARVSGASWWVSMKSIWIPLMVPSLIASWFLVFMPAFSELTMTILLTGPGLETLGTLLYQFQEYSDASGGGAAVLSLFIISIVTISNYFVKFISKGKYGL